jgi:DNA processing protein
LPGLDGDDSAAEDGAAGKVSPELTKTSRDVLGRLQIDKPTHTDELLETLEGCSSSEIIAALFDLEMLGLIRQLPGRNFVKVW